MPRLTSELHLSVTTSSLTRKGVLCEHRHCAWYAAAKAAAEGIDGSSRLLLTAAFTFDPCQVPGPKAFPCLFLLGHSGWV